MFFTDSQKENRMKKPQQYKLLMAVSALVIGTLVAPVSQAEERSEKYVSLEDISIYGHHATAKALSTQLETWARQELAKSSEALKNQTLISVRPQQELTPGSRISFLLFFLQNTKAQRAESSLLRISGELSADASKLNRLQLEGENKLSETKFSVQVSLLELTAKLTDSVTGTSFVYPIGGSAFDKGVLPRSHGKTIFASPAFVGTIPRSTAIESRTSPAYYAGKPFLRMIPTGETTSLFGFHTTPFDYLDKHKPADKLARGYISAGCLRLKDDDLKEFYQIIAFGGLKAVPVEIKYQTQWAEQHPYPIIKNGYHEVGGYCWKVGEGSSECLKEYQPGARTVFSTVWVEKDPRDVIKVLYDYGRAKMSAIGFEIE